jgi:hypothetical protein
MTAEILNSYKTREAHNTSLWRTADEQTQLRQALQAEVDHLSQLAAKLDKAALEQAAKVNIRQLGGSPPVRAA